MASLFMKCTSPSNESVDLKRHTDRVIFWIIAVAAICMLGMLSMPLFAGKVYTIDDLIKFHLPTRFFYAKALSDGSDFTWCPNLFCGYYLQSEGQVGMYHPLHMFLYRFLPLDLAFNLELLVTFPAIFLGMYLLCRRWRFSPGVCMFGAYTITFNSFMLIRLPHINATATVAHLPWILLCYDIILRGSSRRNVHFAYIMIALLTASQLLLGYPHYYWITSLIEAPYILFVAISQRSFFPLLYIFVFKTLGVLLGCIQLIPTFEAFSLSMRATQNLDFLGVFSLHPINLLQSISPYFLKDPIATSGNTWEGSLYTGVGVFVLCIWLLTRKAELVRNRSMVGLALFLMIAGLILALGNYLPIYPLVMRLPVFGVFRCSNRYDYLTTFGLSIMATCALACILEANRESRRLSKSAFIFLLLIGAIALLCLIYTLATLSAARDPRHWLSGQISPAWMVTLGPVLLVFTAVAVIAALKGSRWAIFAIVLLHVTDLGIFGESFVWLQGCPESLANIMAKIKIPPEKDTGRICSFDNQFIMKGFRITEGYVGLWPCKKLFLNNVSSMSIAGAQWLLVTMEPDKQVKWARFNESFARVRLFCDATVSNDVNSAIKQINWHNTAVVSKEVSLSGSVPGTGLVVKDVPGQIEVLTDTMSKQLLFLSESFHPGWHVAIDGEPGEVIQVFGDFMGCIVDPGKHTVQFSWKPASLAIGKAVSLISAAILCLWLLVLVAIERVRKVRTRSNRRAGVGA
jgi:hypothetical protein